MYKSNHDPPGIHPYLTPCNNAGMHVILVEMLSKQPPHIASPCQSHIITAVYHPDIQNSAANFVTYAHHYRKYSLRPPLPWGTARRWSGTALNIWNSGLRFSSRFIMEATLPQR